MTLCPFVWQRQVVCAEGVGLSVDVPAFWVIMRVSSHVGPACELTRTTSRVPGETIGDDLPPPGLREAKSRCLTRRSQIEGIPPGWSGEFLDFSGQRLLQLPHRFQLSGLRLKG